MSACLSALQPRYMAVPGSWLKLCLFRNVRFRGVTERPCKKRMNWEAANFSRRDCLPKRPINDWRRWIKRFPREPPEFRTAKNYQFSLTTRARRWCAMVSFSFVLSVSLLVLAYRKLIFYQCVIRWYYLQKNERTQYDAPLPCRTNRTAPLHTAPHWKKVSDSRKTPENP